MRGMRRAGSRYLLRVLCLVVTVGGLTLAGVRLAAASIGDSGECTVSTLSAAVLGAAPFGGGTALTIAVAGSSGTTCWVLGKPTVALLDAAGTGLLLNVGSALGGDGTHCLGCTPGPVPVSTTQDAVFYLNYVPDANATGPCPAVATLRIGLPDQTGGVTVPASFPSCDLVTVTAFQAG